VTVAIEKVDEAVEQVRADNGYAATYPEEREFVLVCHRVYRPTGDETVGAVEVVWRGVAGSEVGLCLGAFEPVF
jgi:hypothetical protein